MKIKTKIIASMAALLACTGVALGSTFAYFNSSKTINNHINAGKLSLNFYLTKLEYDVITSSNTIQSQTQDLSSWTGYDSSKKAVDLKTYSSNVISITNFCPSMSGKATFSVENTGDIPFNYQLDVINKKANLKDGTEVNSYFDSIMKIEKSADSSTAVGVNKSATDLYVKFTFDKDADNTWQEASFTFDICLTATQIHN